MKSETSTTRLTGCYERSGIMRRRSSRLEEPTTNEAQELCWTTTVKRCRERGDTSGSAVDPRTLAHNRYFGRAKELPGVREMFNKGGMSYSPWSRLEDADLKLRQPRRSQHGTLLSKSLGIKEPITMATTTRLTAI